jgi:hypothetical protein
VGVLQFGEAEVVKGFDVMRADKRRLEADAIARHLPEI